MRSESIYQIYLFCEPYLLVLDNESIIDVNLGRFQATSKEEDLLVVEIEDIFFHENLKLIGEKDFSLILQSYDKTDKFISQIELYGEDFTIESNKITFKFDSLTVNSAYPSVNPYWISAIDLYKKERVSYLRNIQIETLLN
jgi:hypothetical protein